MRSMALHRASLFATSKSYPLVWSLAAIKTLRQPLYRRSHLVRSLVLQKALTTIMLHPLAWSLDPFVAAMKRFDNILIEPLAWSVDWCNEKIFDTFLSEWSLFYAITKTSTASFRALTFNAFVDAIKSFDNNIFGLVGFVDAIKKKLRMPVYRQIIRTSGYSGLYKTVPTLLSDQN